MSRLIRQIASKPEHGLGRGAGGTRVVRVHFVPIGLVLIFSFFERKLRSASDRNSYGATAYCWEAIPSKIVPR